MCTVIQVLDNRKTRKHIAELVMQIFEIKTHTVGVALALQGYHMSF